MIPWGIAVFDHRGHTCNLIFISSKYSDNIAPSNKIADLTSPIITVRDKCSPCVTKVSLSEAPLIMLDYSGTVCSCEKEVPGSQPRINRAFNCAMRA